jgi:hypothetical protein
MVMVAQGSQKWPKRPVYKIGQKTYKRPKRLTKTAQKAYKNGPAYKNGQTGIKKGLQKWPSRHTKRLVQMAKSIQNGIQKVFKNGKKDVQKGPKALQKRSTVLPSDIPFVELVEVDPVGAIAVEDGAES